MVPHIFVSSTITDLHYLRDIIRDTLASLAYQPVMSEHGGVGYICEDGPVDCCFGAIERCDMVILIVGASYGSVDETALSITHQEFKKACEARIPVLTFVESRVRTYFELNRKSPDAVKWDQVKDLDGAEGIFSLLTEVIQSSNTGALISFSGGQEIAHLLKLNLAHFMGDRLRNLGKRTANSDILAEVKALANLLTRNESAEQSIYRVHATVLRFMLDDNCVQFREFIQWVFGDLDEAIDCIAACPDLASLVRARGLKLVGPLGDPIPQGKLPAPGSEGAEACGMWQDGDLIALEPERAFRFDALQRLLFEKVKIARENRAQTGLPISSLDGVKTAP